ncbi:MAG: hypothetical protein ACEY3D_07025 [Rickettsia sp.]
MLHSLSIACMDIESSLRGGIVAWIPMSFLRKQESSIKRDKSSF